MIEKDNTHWVVEVKMDKEMTAADVLGKREAAIRWAKSVTAADEVDVPWRYLLISEANITMAKGSWEALKSLGG